MTPQQKLFFALCHDLGYDTEEMKERAKTKFGKEHFVDLSKHQLSTLIDALKLKASHTSKKTETITKIVNNVAKWDQSDIRNLYIAISNLLTE